MTGKVEADFDFSDAWLDDTPVALAIGDVVDQGAGYYSVEVDMPVSAGRLRLDPHCLNPTTDTVDPEIFEGEVTVYSLDDVAALAARPPSITLASNVGTDAPFRIEVFKGDARTLQIPIYDEDGTLVDLSTWNSLRFSIQNEAQTTDAPHLPYNQTTGITGGADGILTIVLPETCSAYGKLTAGQSSVTLYWSADGDPNDDTLTRTLRGGSFVIKRKETT